MKKIIKEVLMMIAYIAISCVEIEIADKILLAVLPCFCGMLTVITIKTVVSLAHCAEILVNCFKRLIKISNFLEEYSSNNNIYE